MVRAVFGKLPSKDAVYLCRDFETCVLTLMVCESPSQTSNAAGSENVGKRVPLMAGSDDKLAFVLIFCASVVKPMYSQMPVDDFRYW